MTSETAISSVLWDLDGTLIDSEPLHFQSLVRVLDSFGIAADPALQERLTGLSGPEVFRYCRMRFSLDISELEWIQVRTGFYLDEATALLPRPCALELFRQLCQWDVPQAIVSSSERTVVDANLRALGLDSEAVVSISRNDIARPKPDPEPYLLAASRLNVSAYACLVVEDSLPGVRSGEAAGMHVLYWPQNGSASFIDRLPPIRSSHEFFCAASRYLAGIQSSTS